MYYAIILPQDDCALDESIYDDELVTDDINRATQLLKKYKNSRMKTFESSAKALEHLKDHRHLIESILEESLRLASTPDKKQSKQQKQQDDLDIDFSSLSLDSPIKGTQSPQPAASATTTSASITDTNTTSTSTSTNYTTTITKAPVAGQAETNDKSSTYESEPNFPSAKPPLLNTLRRKIESGHYEDVEDTIWSNPRTLVTCTDSAVYLMAGPKYNAAHISARGNKPDMMALILDTITNLKFIRKLYPNETDASLQVRANHLLDSYLNTPDPRQGNTPLHFACKLGHYRVVRVLLTFEGCDLNLRDSNGLTAEESSCTQFHPKPSIPSDATSDGGDGCGGNNGATGGTNEVAKVKEKIRKLFKQQLAMPAFRDQLRKRLMMERRRSRASNASNISLDSSMDTSFSDIDDSFILNRSLPLEK